MLGLDDQIAQLSDGVSVGIVVLVAILLGVRHATDPDHLAAVTTLIAGGRDRAVAGATRLGALWGLGHGVTVFAFGLPVLLLSEHLPERVVQAAETAIAILIVYLALRLLVRWRRGAFHVHEHAHGGAKHVHLHSHAHDAARPHIHAHEHRSRTPLGAFGIGLVHGLGGSAGVGILIVASVESRGLAVAALLLLAFFTALAMTMLTTGLGRGLASRPVREAFPLVAPALGVVSLAFGLWYGGAAWSLFPYPF